MQKVTSAHSDTQLERKLLCASIGFEDFVRKGMNVNSFMSMICQRCQNATSFQDLVSTTIYIHNLELSY